MDRRVLRSSMFLGSTLEEVEEEFGCFLIDKNVCPGNYVDIKLYKHGNVYQLIFVYAKLQHKAE